MQALQVHLWKNKKKAGSGSTEDHPHYIIQAGIIFLLEHPQGSQYEYNIQRNGVPVTFQVFRKGRQFYGEENEAH